MRQTPKICLLAPFNKSDAPYNNTIHIECHTYVSPNNSILIEFFIKTKVLTTNLELFLLYLQTISQKISSQTVERQ